MDRTAKKFLLTGFGGFGDVTLNPTDELMQSISNEERIKMNIVDIDVLEVSIKGVDEYIDCISSLDLEINSNCVFLHFGVKRNISKIDIEQCCYNNANFRMPDCQNEQPQNQKISQKQDLDECNQTIIDCNQLLESNSFLKDHCQLSVDPGRFLCNYIYFKTRTTYPQSPSLFIHVPHFTDIDKDTQKNILIQLINTLQNNTLLK